MGEKRYERSLHDDFAMENFMNSTLGDVCAYLIETSKEDDSIDCVCHLSDYGEMLLSCTSTICTLCDEQRDVCAIPAISYNLDSVMSSPSFASGETYALQYISGDREERIEIEMVGCDLMSGFCSECRAFVENEECNSCFLCDDDEVQFDIDCENVAENSSFKTCDSSLEDENGSFVGDAKFLECVASPPNANCAGANSPMFPDDGLILGSTITSIYDGEPECLNEWRSPGLWYLVIGTGDTFRVDTCSNHTNFDTEISLYRGICGVSLECMGGNDDSCSGVTSALQWKTEIGVLYYVKVHGHGLDSVGYFGLTFSRFPSPVNAMCSGAEFLQIGMSRTASTVGAATINDDDPTCGASNSQLSPSIWYTIRGNGKAITASTCGPGTEISTSLSVYSGSCNGDGDLLCETGGEYDYSCLEDKVGAKATWVASDGIDYYIQVISEDWFGGNAELTITESPNLENNFCQSSSELFIDDIETIGSMNFTIGGQIVEPEVSCEYTFESAGAWYSVIGDGGVLRASTCSSTLSFESSVSIFGGWCDNLVCIGWNSASFDSSPDSSNCTGSGNFFSGTVNWKTRVGEVYYILVQGIDSSPKPLAGDFSLSIASVDDPENFVLDSDPWV